MPRFVTNRAPRLCRLLSHKQSAERLGVDCLSIDGFECKTRPLQPWRHGLTFVFQVRAIPARRTSAVSSWYATYDYSTPRCLSDNIHVVSSLAQHRSSKCHTLPLEGLLMGGASHLPSPLEHV